MSDLQTAFYIVGIVFMSVMLIIMLVIAVAVVVIRAKVAAIHRHVDERLATVADWTEKGEAVVSAIRKVAGKKKK
jgi:hypothetical protein